jgi:hypothetical protein
MNTEKNNANSGFFLNGTTANHRSDERNSEMSQKNALEAIVVLDGKKSDTANNAIANIPRHKHNNSN